MSANVQSFIQNANIEKTLLIGYYPGDPAFQDGFSDDARKSGYAYAYYQQLAPFAAWNYDYAYLSRDEAIEALLASNPKFQTQTWQEYYDDSDVVTTLSDEEHAWLQEKGSLKLGYLVKNLPISGQDTEGEPTGALGEVIPLMEEFLGVPIETVAFSNHVTMNEAILNDEVDVIFPVYSDAWTSENKGLIRQRPWSRTGSWWRTRAITATSCSSAWR